jgi:hypothetical protein
VQAEVTFPSPTRIQARRGVRIDAERSEETHLLAPGLCFVKQQLGQRPEIATSVVGASV